MDMSTTIAPKSDQLNADDLISGSRTITITRVNANPGGNGADQPVNVFFEDDGNKPFRPCKSMRRVMVAIWGKDAVEYAGRSMTIYRDPEVTWGGMKVGGIRISHMSHMEREVTLALTATQKQRKPYIVKPLVIEQKAVTPKVDAAALIEVAKVQARLGTAAFTKFWNLPETKKNRETLKPLISELGKLAKDADAADAPADDDPFGLPAIAGETNQPDLEQFTRLFDMIKTDLSDAGSVDQVIELYQDQIAQMAKDAPELHKDLQDEIAEYRKAEASEG